MHRSVFGGHSVAITGSGFTGPEEGTVTVMMGSSPCTVLSNTDTRLVCITGTSATVHNITNNE